MVPHLTFLLLAFAFVNLPTPVDAALFPKKSHVKHIDANGFREVMQENRSFVAAFVAPWCGHCQKLAPELMRAAKGLHPLVPVYAVDCDDNQNKPLCAEQGVKGFPTVKLYPQSDDLPPLEFSGTRTSSSLFYWTSQSVPHKIQRSQDAKKVSKIVANNPGKPKAVLLNKSNKMPLLWKVLSIKYADSIVFVNCRDRRGMVSVDMGFEAGAKDKPKVLVYGKDETEPVRYEGILKLAALSEFFDKVLDGSMDISHANIDAKQEVLNAPESERKNLDDETRIGDAGYGGFNPHGNIDMEELMKYGFNPHGGGHPGAPDAHAAKAGAPAAKASGKAAGKAAGESAGKAADESTGKAVDESAGKAAGKSPGKVTGESGGKAVSEATGKATSKSAGKATGESAGKAAGDAGESTGKATGKSAGKAVGDSTGKAASDSTGKAASKSAGKATGESVGKATDASTGESGGNSVELTPPLTSFGAESSSLTSQTESVTPIHEKTTSTSRPPKESAKEPDAPGKGQVKDEL